MYLRLIPTVLVFTALASPASPQTARSPREMHRLHGDAKAFIAALEDPARDGYQKPREVIDALGLKEGEVIADIGAGSGYFTFRFAHHVGETGRVYAVDINPEMIAHLGARGRELGVKNVATVLARPDDPLLTAAGVDRIFICDTWHHIENRPAYLTVLKNALKPGGQLIIVDFHGGDLPIGPPPSMKIARGDVVKEIEEAGFRLVKEHTFLSYQYFLAFTARQP